MTTARRRPTRASTWATSYSGTIGVDDVIGKAAIIVWPVSRFGFLDSPDIQGDATPPAAARCRSPSVWPARSR